MPTPNDSSTQLTFGADPHLERLTHTTCPPDSERSGTWRNGHEEGPDPEDVMDGALPPRQQDCAATEIEATGSMEDINHNHQPSPTPTNHKSDRNTNGMDEEHSSADGSSPMSTTTEIKDSEQLPSPAPIADTVELSSSLSSRFGIPNVRMIPTHTSSFLRNGSKFRGTQQSDKQQYKVEVEIKYVDMADSFLCGYLRIEGLTEDHPTLTTYFEGEIIGTKHTFQTRHPSWGATDKTDMQHWARFPAWRPLAKQAKNPDFQYKNNTQRENIFMRWKESFLVPDHRVREIMGASFEGFYYICFNQVAGTVSGIYFHAKSEKYQQLELTHVPDNGCFGAMEFR